MALAAAAGTDLTALLNLGAVGVITAILIAFARTAYADLRARADRLEARNTALSDSLREQVVPALTLGSEAMRESAALVNEMRRELGELRRERDALIDELRRERGR